MNLLINYSDTFGYMAGKLALIGNYVAHISAFRAFPSISAPKIKKSRIRVD